MGKLKQILPNQKTIQSLLLSYSGSGWSTLRGSELKFTAAQRAADNGRAFSNLYTSFNMPSTSARTEAFLSTWTNTGFSGLSTNNVIVCELVKNTYGELIDGRTIKLTIPNNSGGTFTIYSSYYEPEPFASDNSVQGEYFGNPRVLGNTKGKPGVGATNVAFLFSDLIKVPSIASTNTNINTWSDGWQSGITPNGYDGAGTDNFRFLDTVTASNIPKANAEAEDTPVGIAYLDKGFLVITDPTIISQFQFSGATTGGTGDPYGRHVSTAVGQSAFTQIYFSSATQAQCEFYSFEKEWEININVTAESGEFYVTENQTASPAESPYYGAGGNNTGIQFKTPFGDMLQAWDLSDISDTYITEVGLYDNTNNLLAIAKPDRPIKKPKNQPVTLTLKLKF